MDSEAISVKSLEVFGYIVLEVYDTTDGVGISHLLNNFKENLNLMKMILQFTEIRNNSILQKMDLIVKNLKANSSKGFNILAVLAGAETREMVLELCQQRSVTFVISHIHAITYQFQ